MPNQTVFVIDRDPYRISAAKMITSKRIDRMLRRMKESEAIGKNFERSSSSDRSKLTTLNLSSISATDLDSSSFQRFPALHRLNLSNNSLTQISCDVLKPIQDQLTWLDISKNNFKSLEDVGIMCCTSLVTLNLSRNRLARLPKKGFSSLGKIEGTSSAS